MKRIRHTSFYTEAFVLICVFVAVILLLTRCFAAAESSRQQAKDLTCAVTLARSAAEAAADTAEPGELLRILLPDKPSAGEVNGERLIIRYDEELVPDRDGILQLLVTWNREDGVTRYTVKVSNAETEREIYTLETAAYTERGSA